MFTKLMTATALVMVSGGLAFAQASGTGSTSTEGASAGFQWDQMSQDSFFSNGALRSEADVRAAYDALDTTQKDQLRVACGSDAASGTGSATGSGPTTAPGTTGTSASGSASDSTTTTGSATTGSGSTGTAASGSSGSIAGSDSAASMPDAASMEQLCAQIRSY